MVPTLVYCLTCIRLRISTLIISIVIGHLCYAQEEKNSRMMVFPVIFSSPETSLGFGAAAIRYFRTDTSSFTKPSSVQAIFIYTLQNQMLSQIPVELFLDNNKYWLKINHTHQCATVSVEQVSQRPAHCVYRGRIERIFARFAPNAICPK